MHRPPASAARGRAVLKVMLVDDSAILRSRLNELLLDVPALQVIAETGDGQHAVRLAQEHRPDVVVLELHLPGRDALAMLLDVLAAAPDATAIVFTGFSSEANRSRALDAGADFFYDKAEDLDRLLATMRLLAERAAA